MNRSPTRHRMVGLLTATGLCLTLNLLPAHADDPSVPPDQVKPTIIDIKPNIVDIGGTVKDLAGAATESSSDKTYDVRLDSNVLFGKDSAAIRPKARARLDEIAAELAKRDPGNVTITGYTDDLGSAQHGLVLSKQRAAAVNTILGPKLKKHTVKVTGRGEADPIVPNKDEASRSTNRRVEIHYAKK